MVAQGLLSGAVALDLTRIFAGPHCGMLLADTGATVIKMEMIRRENDSKAYGPFTGEGSCHYMRLNKGKRGCTLNLKTEKGRAILLEIIKKVDILIENCHPGTVEKLHLGYDESKRADPGLIYGTVSRFDHTGPYGKRAGYDIIDQAAGSLMSTIGWEGDSSTRMGTPMGDVLGGLNLTIRILVALSHKNKTGQGEEAGVVLVDVVVSAMQDINMIYLSEGRMPTRTGNRYEPAYPYDSFRTSNGDVIIGAGNDKLYVTLYEEMGMLELGNNPRLLTISDRVKNHAALEEIIEMQTSKSTIDEIANRLNKVRVPSTPVDTIDCIVEDPQIAGARKMFLVIRQPGIGGVPTINNAPKFTNCPVDPEEPAPTLGQDNDMILNTHTDLSFKGIEELRTRKTIRQRRNCKKICYGREGTND